MAVVVAGIRCFVAVDVDEVLRARLGDLIGLLRGSGADVKWVEPQSLHVTLKFLGDVAPADIPGVTGAIRSALAGKVPPFELGLTAVGAFPSVSRPRVIWVGVSVGRDKLSQLVTLVDESLAALGFSRETRPYSPHLTLGRARSQRNLDELRAAMSGLGDWAGPRATVDRVTFYSSTLKPSGPVYVPLAEFPLSGSEGGGGAADRGVVTRARARESSLDG